MELMNIFFMTVMALPRDMKMTYDYMQTISRVYYWHWQNYPVYELFDQVTHKHRHQIAFRHGYITWSFHMIQDYSQKVANYFHSKGLQPRDVVAQVGVEGPEAVALWLGLSRIGVVTAFVPSNLPPASQVKVAASVFSKYIVCPPSLVNDLSKEKLPHYMSLMSTDVSQNKDVLDIKTETFKSKYKLSKSVKVSIDDKFMYLFNLKTLTPMPLTHYSYLYRATIMRTSLDIKDKDVIYAPIPKSLPLRTIAADGQAVIFGNTVVSGKKLSSEKFFANCHHYAATVALYNPEILQPLMASPQSTSDTNHKVRLIMGRGLTTPQAWQQFKERFKVKKIGEFYASLETDSYDMVNNNNKPGAIGFFPWFTPPQHMAILVAFDPNTGVEIRNHKGRCVTPKTGQPGILLDKFPTNYERAQFARKKKIMRDVFKKGDKYINTGEILKRDREGYFYYVGSLDDKKPISQKPVPTTAG